DPLRGEQPHGSDLTVRLEALRAFRRDGRDGARRWGADPAACARIEQVARRWRQRLPLESGETSIEATAVGLLLALAYPDRIAKQRDGGERYRLANGRG
ncbi:MAG TPA: ATP-dependent helicase HrpB, partial [Candidatus Competibacteraceae bacterium]|nr:ATP-dependent helicase HrpB [Candidatus Competibacteraceae bacterium]